AFLGAHLLQRAAHALDQGVELLGHQLDRHEQLGQGRLLLLRLLAAAAVFLQGLAGLLQLLGHGAEATGGFFRVRSAIAFVIGIAVAFLVLFLVVLGLGGGFLQFGLDFLGRQAAVVRVDVAAEHVGQAATLGGHALVFGEDAVHGAREVGDGAHHFADAFLDALGDLDLAFAGQQLHGAHFAHVHAHRVGGAADVGLYRGQGGGGFFSGGFVGIGFGKQQRIGIRRALEDVDAHVVDHADDVFDLFRIGDVFRQVVVDFGVGQVALLPAAGDQLF